MGTEGGGVMAVLDRGRVRGAVVCGLSLGGYIVFELLRRFPERGRAAILCNTKAVADTPEARRGRDALAARATEEGPGAVAAELDPKLFACSPRARRPEARREARQTILRRPSPG